MVVHTVAIEAIRLHVYCHTPPSVINPAVIGRQEQSHDPIIATINRLIRCHPSG